MMRRNNVSEFFLPEPRKQKIIVTPMMQEVINRSLSVHLLGALIVWFGAGRIGKTTTACYLVNWLNKRFDAHEPGSFRAFNYEVGRIAKGSGNEWKQAIRSLYQATFGTQMDQGFYLRNPPEELARHTVHGLRRIDIQFVIVDEAARLSSEAIQAMSLIRDVAHAQDWPLTIVFVGKDDLPRLMTKVEHVHKRVLEWCYFTEYSLEDTWTFLTELHPYFASLDAKKADHIEQVQAVHELCTGLPGLMVPLLQQLDYRLSYFSGTVDAKFIRAVHQLTNRSMIDALKESALPYKPHKAKAGNHNQRSAPASKPKEQRKQ